MYTHSIDDLLPHAPLHYAATGEMVKGSYKAAFNMHSFQNILILNNNAHERPPDGLCQ